MCWGLVNLAILWPSVGGKVYELSRVSIVVIHCCPCVLTEVLTALQFYLLIYCPLLCSAVNVGNHKSYIKAKYFEQNVVVHRSLLFCRWTIIYYDYNLNLARFCYLTIQSLSKPLVYKGNKMTRVSNISFISHYNLNMSCKAHILCMACLFLKT